MISTNKKTHINMVGGYYLNLKRKTFVSLINPLSGFSGYHAMHVAVFY